MNKVLRIAFSIVLSLLIITGVTKFAISFKQLYYFDIGYLNISEMTNMSDEELKLNYDYLIDYLDKDKYEEFELPTLKSSENGKIHFEEVRDIFQVVDKIFYLSLVISLVGIYIGYKSKDFEFLRYSSNIITVLPLTLLAIVAINFQKSFVIFHKILFRNDYWIFDPSLDPVINMLPEQFFFHEGVVILILIVVISLLLKFAYNKLKVRRAR